MMAIIGGFTFGGYKIDQWLQNDFKAFTFGLMIFSVVVALVHGTRGILKKTESTAQDKEKNDNLK